ncbi:MAG TPA: tetratricopeptide repeat protein [Thermoanaerobaculia bacterium]|nr:tetratricopeptide repeat protein [Thermoanaerobaculia bacterium]
MHVTEILLDALERGKVSPELMIEILMEHVPTTCAACSEGIAAHQAGIGRGRGGSAAEARDPVARLARRLAWGERQLREEVKIARRQVREIVRLDPARRCAKIRGANSRYQGPLFGALLLEEARRKIPAEPAEALALAEAALVSSSKRTRRHQPDPEVQAAALAVGGNARRALGRLREAEADLEEALRLLDAPGLRDPALPAELYSYLGSLRMDQGRLDEAARHLRRAGALYGLLGEPEKTARVLLKLGGVHFRAHAFDAAVEAVEAALELLPPDAEAWLRAYAHYNRAYSLHARGDLDRAEAELAAHAELLGAAGDQVAQHVVWLRARIAWSRGDLRAAARLFKETRRRALERGIAFETSLISLELALVHLVQGQTGRVKTLAVEALAVFAEQEVEREIQAALALVEAAARRETLTREVVERAIAALERARHASGREPA